MARAVARGVLRLFTRTALGVVIGLAVAAAYWSAIMIRGGHGILEALRGQVEDGLGTLQGLAALGVLVGAGVGLASGLAAISNDQA